MAALVPLPCPAGMGDFLFDTFQKFHFYINGEVDYKLPDGEKGVVIHRDVYAQQIESAPPLAWFWRQTAASSKQQSAVSGKQQQAANSKRAKLHRTTGLSSDGVLGNMPMENSPEVFGLHPDHPGPGMAHGSNQESWSRLKGCRASNMVFQSPKASCCGLALHCYVYHVVSFWVGSFGLEPKQSGDRS